MKFIIVLLIGSLILSGCVVQNLSKTELGQEFCPDGYSDDGMFSYTQLCKGKPFTCSYDSQKCYWSDSPNEVISNGW